jgi:hypothetical protein
LVALALGRLGTWSLCSGVSALRVIFADIIFLGRSGSPPGPALGHACTSLLWLDEEHAVSGALALWSSVSLAPCRANILALSHCGTQSFWRLATLALSNSGVFLDVCLRVCFLRSWFLRLAAGARHSPKSAALALSCSAARLGRLAQPLWCAKLVGAPPQPVGRTAVSALGCSARLLCRARSRFSAQSVRAFSNSPFGA